MLLYWARAVASIAAIASSWDTIEMGSILSERRSGHLVLDGIRESSRRVRKVCATDSGHKERHPLMA